MTKVTKTTFDSQAAAYSARNKKINAKREVTAAKASGLAAATMTDRPTLPLLSLSLQELREDQDGLDFLLFLHDALLSQPAEPLPRTLKKLRMVRHEIAI